MGNTNAFDLALGTGPIVKAVLGLLIMASIVSWAIIFAKFMAFKKARKESETFLDIFWNSKSLEGIFSESRNFSASPVSNVFREGYKEFQKVSAKVSEKGAPNPNMAEHGLDNVQRALRKASISESLKLESLLAFLATVASSAPFIGLFGTVWGIMSAFQGLGAGGPATIQRVAPGISEALIATAVGLAAAIPAVIAYNSYIQKVRGFRIDMDSFASDFTNILKRNYLG